MVKRKIALGIIAVLILVLISICSSIWLRSSGAKNEMGFGVEFNTHATPIWLVIHSELPEKYGLEIEPLFKFRTGADLAASLARGDVEVGVACLGPILNLIDRGVEVKLVGKVHNHGYALVVNPEKIKSLEDLNNSTIYSTGVANPTNLLLLKVQDLYNLKFNIKPIGDPQTILSMLISGQIDASALPEHYSTVAEERGMKVLLRSQDVWPNMPGSYVVVRSDILEDKPEVVKNVVSMISESIKLIKENKSLASHACSLELGVSDYMALKSIGYLEWNTEINTMEIQEYIDFMYAHGVIDKRINASEIVAWDWK